MTEEAASVTETLTVCGCDLQPFAVICLSLKLLFNTIREFVKLERII